MKRKITEIRAKALQDLGKSLRLRMTGSGEDHYITCLDGEWRCDCMAFQTQKKCRHVKSGIVIQHHLSRARDDIERGEESDWKNQ